MNNKKVIILIIAAIGAVISLYYGFKAPPRSKYATSPLQGSIAPKTEVAMQQKQEITGAMRRAKRTRFTLLPRSPFSPKGVATAGITLNGIVGTKNEPRAMINNTIVKVGDRVEGYTVVDIKKETVTLSKGDKNFVLKLKQ